MFGSRTKLATLVVGIKADLKQYNAGMDEAEDKAKGLAVGLIATSAEVKALSIALAAYSAAVTAAIVASINAYADLEQSIANTASVTGATADEMNNLEMFARKMGETTVYKSSEAADAMYFLGCLKPDGIVLTENGAKEIQTVKKGDSVVGFNGSLTKVVSDLMIRPCHENEIVNIQPTCNLAFEVTPNHPVYAIKTQRCHRNKTCWCKPNCERKCASRTYENYNEAEWIPAGELTHGDALAIPKNKNEKTVELEFEWDRYYRQYEKLPKIVDNDFAKFLGIILGDGWANSDGERIGVAFNENEEENLEWYKSYLSRLGYSCTSFYNPGCIQLVTWSRPLNKFIAKYMGQGAKNKRIPQFMFDAKKEIIFSFLEGYFLSDGSLFENQGKNKLSYTTVSPNIAYSVNYLVSKFGYYFNVSEFEPKKDTRDGWRDWDQKTQYSISTTDPDFIESITKQKQNSKLRYVKTWQDDNFIYFPIKHINIEQYGGNVYNFETEDKTYSTGVIVHNSAGLEVKEIMSSLEGTLALAAATQYSLSETTRIVISTLRAFELEASEADRLSNVFAATISSSQAQMWKLGGSLKYVAPLAHAVGLSVEQMSAMLGKMYNAGIHAQQAGTAMRMGLARLLKPSDAARDAIRRLGYSWKELTPATNDIITILNRFKAAGAGAAEQMDEMTEIFGMRAVTAWMLLAREGGNALDVYTKKLTGTTKAYDMMEIQINTLRGKQKLLSSAIQESANIVGKMFTPAISNILDMIRSFIYTLNDLPPIVQKLGVGIISVTAIFAGVTAAILAVTKAAGLLWGAIKLGIAIAIGWGGAITGIVAAIGLLVVGLAAWATAEERNARARKKRIASMKKENEKRIQTEKKLRSLAEKYEELYSKEERTNEETERMTNILNDINELYPGAISDTDDFASSLGDVEEVANRANKSLKILSEREVRLRTIQAEDDLDRLDKKIKDLGSEFENLSEKEVILSYEEVTEGDTQMPSFGSEQTKLEFGWVMSTADIKKRIESINKELKETATASGGLKILMGHFNTLEVKAYDLEKEIGNLNKKSNELGRGETERLLKQKKNQKEAYELMAGYISDIITKMEEVNKKEEERLEVRRRLTELRSPTNIMDFEIKWEGESINNIDQKIKEIEGKIYKIKMKRTFPSDPIEEALNTSNVTEASGALSELIAKLETLRKLQTKKTVSQQLFDPANYELAKTKMQEILDAAGRGAGDATQRVRTLIEEFNKLNLGGEGKFTISTDTSTLMIKIAEVKSKLEDLSNIPESEDAFKDLMEEYQRLLKIKEQKQRKFDKQMIRANKIKNDVILNQEEDALNKSIIKAEQKTNAEKMSLENTEQGIINSIRDNIKNKEEAERRINTMKEWFATRELQIEADLVERKKQLYIKDAQNKANIDKMVTADIVDNFIQQSMTEIRASRTTKDDYMGTLKEKQKATASHIEERQAKYNEYDTNQKERYIRMTMFENQLENAKSEKERERIQKKIAGEAGAMEYAIRMGEEELENLRRLGLSEIQIDGMIANAKMQNAQKWAGYISSAAQSAGEAMAAFWEGDQEGAKNAAAAMISVFTDVFVGYLQMQMAQALAGTPPDFVPNFAGAIAAAIGIATVKAVGSTVTGAIKGQPTPKTKTPKTKKPPKPPKAYSAEIGAVVDKPGLAMVHKGEIIPQHVAKSTFAGLSRLPDSSYGRMLERRIGIPETLNRNENIERIRNTKNVNANIVLSLDGSLITTNDDEAVDTFYREVLEPAGERLQRLIEE